MIYPLLYFYSARYRGPKEIPELSKCLRSMAAAVKDIYANKDVLENNIDLDILHLKALAKENIAKNNTLKYKINHIRSVI